MSEASSPVTFSDLGESWSTEEDRALDSLTADPSGFGSAKVRAFRVKSRPQNRDFSQSQKDTVIR